MEETTKWRSKGGGGTLRSRTTDYKWVKFPPPPALLPDTHMFSLFFPPYTSAMMEGRPGSHIPHACASVFQRSKLFLPGNVLPPWCASSAARRDGGALSARGNHVTGREEIYTAHTDGVGGTLASAATPSPSVTRFFRKNCVKRQKKLRQIRHFPIKSFLSSA